MSEIESAEEVALLYCAQEEGYSQSDTLADLIRTDRRAVLEEVCRRIDTQCADEARALIEEVCK